MSENKNAAPVLEHRDGNGISDSGQAVIFPMRYYIMLRGRLARVLCLGHENAIPGHEIMAALNLKDGRDVSAMIERERRRGVPICATTNSEKPGYYLPATAGELAEYNKSLRRRIRNITATLDAMETALDFWTRQTRLDLTGGDDGGR